MWGGVPGGYRNTINDNIVLILMIETLEGLKNADEIAKVPGVTAIFAASGDLGNFSGYRQGTPDYERAINIVHDAAIKAKVQAVRAARLARSPRLHLLPGRQRDGRDRARRRRRARSAREHAGQAGSRTVRQQAVMRALMIAGALLMAPALAAQQTPPPDPLVKEGVTVKVADHTFVIPDGNVGLVPNVGIVVGSRATLVIDPGLGQTQRRDGVARGREGEPQRRALYRLDALSRRAHDRLPRVSGERQVRELARAGGGVRARAARSRFRRSRGDRR